MFTILAWMVFIPALIWNIVLFGVILDGTVKNGIVDWKNIHNWYQLALSIVFLFVPGVYLFGWF